MQSRKDTIVEVLTGTFLGLLGSWLITYLCVQLISNKAAAVTVATALCTVWSLVRGYSVRRWFNRPSRPQSARYATGGYVSIPKERPVHTLGAAIARGAILNAMRPNLKNEVVVHNTEIKDWPELPSR